MAMLAEKKSKTRYFLHHKAFDPRGNTWCEDSSKFGQRMLEKMGWSPGKGLGATESGSTDPVKVAYKWDSKGMGYKGTDEADATAQQTGFNELLTQLNAGSCETSTPTSLEQRSNNSRARLHYKKFTRGKDLSRASSKDLACILGVVGDTAKVPSPSEELVIPDVGPPIDPIVQTTFGITTIARGNLTEYFKQKFQERQSKKAASDDSTGRDEKSKKRKAADDDSSFCSERDTPVQDGIGRDVDLVVNKKRKKDKKGQEVNNENELVEWENQGQPQLENCSEGETINQDIDGGNGSKKKKKNRKNAKGAGGEVSIIDEQSCATQGRRKSVTWGEVEVSFVSKYIKDMVDTSSESLNMSSDDVFEDSDVGTNLEGCASKNETQKKKSRKNRSMDQVETANLVVDSDEAQEQSIKVKKKKKKKKDKNDSLLHSKENIETGSVAPDQIENSFKKRKKKRKNDSTSVEVDSSAPVTGQINPEEDASKNVKKDKKKKKEIVEMPVQGTPDVNALEMHDGHSDEHANRHKVRKEKKKKKDAAECEPAQNFQIEPHKKEREKNIARSSDETGKINLPEPCRVSKECVNKISKEDQLRSQPSLSKLTQERMAKWKGRQKTKNPDFSHVLTINPTTLTKDYNGRKVLVALGYRVDKTEDKDIVVKLPPSNFSGSNLDSIVGYGQGVLSC